MVAPAIREPQQGARKAEHAQWVEAVANPATDLVAFKKEEIKGAIRTDSSLFLYCI